ncbi:MAG: CoA-binding protein, partial [Desulfocucumaceae bacterium]
MGKDKIHIVEQHRGFEGKGGVVLGDLKSFFNPESVTIIGASKIPGKIGNAIVKNIIDSGYHGEIFPVNPREAEILDLKCFPEVGA